MFPPRHPNSVAPSPFAAPPIDPDSAIRLTDTDALLARWSAVQKGYIQDDPWVKHLIASAKRGRFVPGSPEDPSTPRPPLINVGTYVRGWGIDRLVEAWLETFAREDKKVQIVSLGAGSDTRYWRLSTGKYKDVIGKYIEMDFPEVTTKKAMTIKKNKELNAVVGASNIALEGTALHGERYHLLPIDLRLPPNETLGKLLADEAVLLSHDQPTLLLFECVLAYVEPERSDAVLQWFVHHVKGPTPLGAIVYEMFGLEDSFGRVMVNNLKSRNVTIPGAVPYTTLESCRSRFTKNGLVSGSGAVSLSSIRREYLGGEETDRLSRCEMLDEVEELDLVLGHYAVSWGWNGSIEWQLAAVQDEDTESQRED